MRNLKILDRIENWHAAVIIGVLGLATFLTGLNNPFQGDDETQIVDNPTVHSIKNIVSFFKGGSNYDGSIHAKLIGDYYRPLMTTIYSLIYTVFGPHPFYFHALQLILAIAATFILYMVFRYSFKPLLALLLSLVFLLHPIDSQVVFAIPYLQDTLFFFFGILGLWLLIRLNSNLSMALATGCFFLSLLSKESGILFVIMALLYLFWWKRWRIVLFISMMVVPLVLWFILRINAVGLVSKLKNAPIQNLHLADRLMNIPSILLFYINKFFFPFTLASGYYWIHDTFSVRYFLLPLIVDLLALTAIIYVGTIIKRRATKAQFYTYLFFTTWLAIGLLLCSQIIASDMTVSEPWFYFPMAGLLGMVGVAVQNIHIRINPHYLLMAVVILLALLGARTALRGRDWRNQYILASYDVVASPSDYTAYDTLAAQAINDGNYSKAQQLADNSIKIYPTFSNYDNLGGALVGEYSYTAAFRAYQKALQYEQGNTSPTLETMATLTLVQGNANSDKYFLAKALRDYPDDDHLWLCLTLYDAEHNNIAGAKLAALNAVKYGNGQIPQSFYDDIVENHRFQLNTLGKNIEV